LQDARSRWRGRFAKGAMTPAQRSRLVRTLRQVTLHRLAISNPKAVR
jgi:hypothetical protein